MTTLFSSSIKTQYIETAKIKVEDMAEHVEVDSGEQRRPGTCVRGRRKGAAFTVQVPGHRCQDAGRDVTTVYCGHMLTLEMNEENCSENEQGLFNKVTHTVALRTVLQSCRICFMSARRTSLDVAENHRCRAAVLLYRFREREPKAIPSCF